MDETQVNLIRDQFRSIHDKIEMSYLNLDKKVDQIHADVREHIEKDEQYWVKIDENEAKISLLKWLFSGASGSALLAWLYQKFGIH